MGPVKWPQTRRRDRAERYADSEATTRVSLVFLGLDPDLVAPSPSFPALVSLENSGEIKRKKKRSGGSAISDPSLACFAAAWFALSLCVFLSRRVPVLPPATISGNAKTGGGPRGHPHLGDSVSSA